MCFDQEDRGQKQEDTRMREKDSVVFPSPQQRQNNNSDDNDITLTISQFCHTNTLCQSVSQHNIQAQVIPPAEWHKLLSLAHFAPKSSRTWKYTTILIAISARARQSLRLFPELGTALWASWKEFKVHYQTDATHTTKLLKTWTNWCQHTAAKKT